MVTFALSIAVLILILTKLKGEWADAQGETFDVFGSLIYGLSLVFLILGVSFLPEKKSILMLALSALGMISFVFLEKRISSPVFEVNLMLENRAFALSNIAALIHYSATFAVTFMLSLYLQYIKGLSAQTAGVILIAQPVMMAIFSPVAGKISDRIEPRIIASLGMVLTFCGLIILRNLNTNTGMAYIIGVLLLMGVGFALFSSPNMNAIMSSVDRRFLGVASGSAGTMRVLGQLLSMGMATLVLAVVIGRVPITENVYPQLVKSMKYIFTVSAGLTFLGFFASLNRGNVRNP